MRFTGWLLASTLIALAPAALAAERELSPQAQEGRRLYEFYCSNCHGADAKGDGPTAEVLLVKPTNLTKLSKTNGGKFPLGRVIRNIDGREQARGHGNMMPIWGLGFQDPTSDSNQEEEVRRRIDDLVAYLQELQR